MKPITIPIISLFVFGSNENQIEEFTFSKTLEYYLVDLCGKDDKECISAVKSQTKSCMEKSNWRRYLENQDSEAELKKFTTQFYSCVVDSDGKPYNY